MSNEAVEEFEEFLRYLRSMVVSFLILFSSMTIALAVYREPLYFVFSLATRGLGTVVIAGKALAPLVSFIYVVLLYSFIAWIPFATIITYRYVKPAIMYEHELRLLRTYSIAIPLVMIASLFLALYVFYPAFIRISVMFAELVGVEPMYTVDSITSLFVASLILTAVTLVEPLALHTAMQFSEKIRGAIVGSNIRDRALVYAGLYWLYAILTPGDTVFATLLYMAILVMGTELVIAYWKHKRKNKLLSQNNKQLH